ncbi:Serine/threonine-protein kinase [Microsporum audouinii]
MTLSIADFTLGTSPRPPGILTITLHEGAGFSTVDCYRQISNNDLSSDATKAHPSQYLGGSFVYALLNYEMSQVTVESFFGTSEGPTWGVGYYAERELFVPCLADLTVHLYIGGHSTVDQDIFLGMTRVNLFERYKTPESLWLELQDGAGRIRVSFKYRHIEDKPLKYADFKYITKLGKPHTVSYGMEADQKTFVEKKIDITKAQYITTKQPQINHPFIAPLSLTFNLQGTLYLLSPFVSGGHLFRHIQKQRSFDIERSRLYTAEILCALDYLHNTHGIISWLKPENVLLDSLGHIVLCGFSLFTRERDTYTMPEYPAPELLLNHGKSKSADWWTLGIFLYEMLIGLPAYFHDDPKMIYQRILNLDQPIEFPESIPPTAKDIITKLLDPRPERRLGANGGAPEIKAHPFFDDVDWHKLDLREYRPPFRPNYVMWSFGRYGFPISMPDEFDGFQYNKPLLRRNTIIENNSSTLKRKVETYQVVVDDGWELIWENGLRTFYFYNRYTEAKQPIPQAVAPNDNTSNATTPRQAQKQAVLEAALRAGYNHAISQLLEYGVDLNTNIFVTSTAGGKSPLEWATEHENYNLVALFLDMGADAGFSTLKTAMDKRNHNIIKAVVQKSNRIASTRALGLAIDQQDITMVTFLLENGVQCNFQEEDRPSPEYRPSGSAFDHDCPLYHGSWPQEFIPPLVRAVKHGYIDIARLLLNYGADVNIGYHDLGWDLTESHERGAISFSCGRVIQLAMELGHLEIAQLLLASGADIDLIHPTWCVPGHECHPGSRAVYQKVTASLRVAAKNKGQMATM